MQNHIQFVLDNHIAHVSLSPPSPYGPTTTVLQYLRSLPGHCGVKEGCAEGDCGACTVVIAELLPGGGMSYRAVDSCLVFLPMVHRKQVITVENLRQANGDLHPVQRAMVAQYGSQCGFCTPGIVMSLFAEFRADRTPSHSDIVDALAGNLCRCTGYRAIINAAFEACRGDRTDHISTGEPLMRRLLRTIPADALMIEDGVQRYFRPATIGEALSYRAAHPDALVLCGATDVALRVTKQHEIIPSILDLSGIEALRGLADAGDALHVGATATLQELLTACDGLIPPLHRMLQVFGSRQIRNIATLGGNLGTSSPISDTIPVLIALGAQVVLESQAGQRVLPIGAFIRGYRRNACGPDELITSIIIPRVPEGIQVRSYKISRRREMDISTVSGGFRLELDASHRVASVILAFGGMAESARRAERAEARLQGNPWTREGVAEAAKEIDHDFSPISDVRGSAGYRKTIARNLLLRFWDDVQNGGADPLYQAEM